MNFFPIPIYSENLSFPTVALDTCGSFRDLPILKMFTIHTRAAADPKRANHEKFCALSSPLTFYEVNLVTKVITYFTFAKDFSPPLGSLNFELKKFWRPRIYFKTLFTYV